MALTSTEIDRCRYECGYASTRIGAEPYVAYSPIFDVAIQPYVTDVGSTSTTVVTAASGGARVAVTVAANPTLPQRPGGLAFVAGVRVTVDYGPLQERDVVVEAVVGLDLYMTLENAHGTGGIQYPVFLAGAEQPIRDLLDRLDVVRAEMRDIAPRTAGVAQADKDVELYASLERGRAQRSKWDELVAIQDRTRDELCQALNLPNYWRIRAASRGGSALEV